MYKLVNPLQASFIKGHHIIDNVIIPQEIIHSMEATKGKMGYMVAKIDLANAYDRLSWNFIIDTLFDIGFPHYCINLIIKCLTTSYMQVYWNGSLSNCFTPSRAFDKEILCLLISLCYVWRSLRILSTLK